MPDSATIQILAAGIFLLDPEASLNLRPARRTGSTGLFGRLRGRRQRSTL